MSSSPTRVLTAHVPVPLAEKVDQFAVRLDRSRGWIVKQALAAWIAEQESVNASNPTSPKKRNRTPIAD